MNSAKQKRVKIIYGWAEGPWHGKRLRLELKNKGYTIVRSAKRADIIIAHSGGCFLLPDSGNAVLILLIGLPYWPSKNPLRSLRQKVKDELKNLYWYKKTLFNSYYLFSRPRKLLRITRGWRKQSFPNHERAQVLAVRNDSDHFMHPIDAKTLAEDKNWKLEIFPGGHDDIWHNPKPYVELIDAQY